MKALVAFRHYATGFTGESDLDQHSGQMCELVRELGDTERDREDVGRMFHVRFLDGFEADAFEDELEIIR